MLYLYAGNPRLTFARSLGPLDLINPFLGCGMPPIAYIKSALQESGVKSSQQSTLNPHSVLRPRVNSQQSTVNSHRKQMLAQLSRLVQGLEQSPVLEWVRKQRICSSFYSELT